MTFFVIFHTLLVSGRIPIGLGYFIPPFGRKIGGKKEYMRGISFYESPSLAASEVNVSSAKVQNNYSKLPSVNIA